MSLIDDKCDGGCGKVFDMMGDPVLNRGRGYTIYCGTCWSQAKPPIASTLTVTECNELGRALSDNSTLVHVTHDGRVATTVERIVATHVADALSEAIAMLEAEDWWGFRDEVERFKSPDQYTYSDHYSMGDNDGKIRCIEALRALLPARDKREA